MRYITYHIIAFLLLLLAPCSVYAQAVQSPFTHYLSQNAHSSEDDILSFVADFGEGREYLFISLGSLVNGKGGNIWRVYEKANDGFEPVSGSVTLRRDALALSTTAGIEGNALISYWPYNVERGMLHAIQVSDGKTIEFNIDTIEPLGKDQKLYAEFFHNDDFKVHVEERPVSEFLALPTPQGDPNLGREKDEHQQPHASTQPTIDSAVAPVRDFGKSQMETEKSVGAFAGQPWMRVGLLCIGLSSLVLVAFLRVRNRQ